MQTLISESMMMTDYDYGPLTVLMEKLFAFIRNSDWEGINEEFRSADMSQDLTLLIGRLRYTYSYHDRISEWVPLRDKVAEVIDKLGKDKTELLQGLYDLRPLDEPYNQAFRKLIGWPE